MTASKQRSVVDRASTFVRVLKRLVGYIPPGSRILDFGCGRGNMVHGFCNLGYDAFGCDLDFEGGVIPELTDRGRLSLIAQEPYTLPFDDGTFDFVVSDMVFEHVMDYDSALREVSRVLKDGGASLHVFASRYTPIEGHAFVPGASLFRGMWWLRLWATLGIRNEFQQGDPPGVVATKNRDYLRDHTNYPTRREVEQAFRRSFPVVRFAESEYLLRDEHGGRLSRLRRLIGGLPLLPSIYGELQNRAVYAAKVRRRVVGASSA